MLDPVDLYIATCRRAANLTRIDTMKFKELCNSLVQLRHMLSCCVCWKILLKPIGPDLQTEIPKCQHMICRDCKHGKVRLKPACGWCADHELFIDKTHIETLIECFMKMCKWISESVEKSKLAEFDSSEDIYFNIITSDFSVPLYTYDHLGKAQQTPIVFHVNKTGAFDAQSRPTESLALTKINKPSRSTTLLKRRHKRMLLGRR